MDTLELHVCQCGPDKQWQITGLCMQEVFELTHTLHDELWRGGNKSCVARACAADPVLGPPKLTGFLVASAPGLLRSSMHKNKSHYGLLSSCTPFSLSVVQRAGFR